MAWLRYSVASPSVQWLRSCSRPFDVGFFGRQSALEQVSFSPEYFAFTLIIPPVFHPHSFIYQKHDIILAVDSIIIINMPVTLKKSNPGQIGTRACRKQRKDEKFIQKFGQQT